MKSNITMTHVFREFGIELGSDLLDKRIEYDNVFEILYEEQVITWEIYKEEILKTKKTVKAPIDFLEVGSGSGFFSILFSKIFGGNVLAIDKNPRAVAFTRYNAKKNNVDIEIRNESYSVNTVSKKSVKVILINPPFHIYPEEIEDKIPLFAKSDREGQNEFKNQLKTASNHLAEGGIIVFIMMCLGNNNKPEYVNYIPELVKNSSLYYMNIFKPIKAGHFLKAVYKSSYPKFQKKIRNKYKQIFFTNGFIKNDGNSIIKEISNRIDLKGKTWDDRILLHRKINSF